MQGSAPDQRAGRKMAILKNELESLIARTAQDDACVLSVYLNVDQSRSGNLNRGYLRSLKELLRNCEQRLTTDKLAQVFRRMRRANSESRREFRRNRPARWRYSAMQTVSSGTGR